MLERYMYFENACLTDTTEYVKMLKQRLEKVYDFARLDMAKTSDRQKKTYSVGDLVWLWNPMKTRGKCPKLQPRREGPYKLFYFSLQYLKQHEKIFKSNNMSEQHLSWPQNNRLYCSCYLSYWQKNYKFNDLPKAIVILDYSGKIAASWRVMSRLSFSL